MLIVVLTDSEDYPNLYSQAKAQGALGAFHNLKTASPAGTKFALSVGGWTMSEAFHKMAESAATRKIFVDSVVKFLDKFPMYKQIDIDWEYPGAEGNGNPHGPEDGKNYTLLVKELRAALDVGNKYKDVAIAIAAAADPAKLALSNIKDLVDAGVTQIHLMTYDLFGGTYGDGKLAHHTNLYSSDKEWSIDQSVQYLKGLGINMKYVHVGYASYSRNAREVEIESVSPLKGTFKVDSNIVGSFENGVTEQYDIWNNYFDPSTGKGKNGFTLYTDKIADADFLYNPTSKVFMSIDTPRTVKAKAEYVKKNGLGGIFTWTTDLDNGVLSNSAHEGLGHTCIKQNIDMSTFYFEGETELVGQSIDSL
ncbi:Chitinase A [Rickettsia tillamookensis]|uniref:chitinase n=1 Tax=Rickettsia tillamookensis TaxID=2761623 RepID=A0A9E6MHX8_9RICK|nr:glycosyl hydrolase family 18 protein [Rickettsia tillamookensis]QQV75437.1 Chitinase A [Rickettsia tillamookensis]